MLLSSHSPRVYSRDSRNHHQHGQSTGQCSSSSGNTPPLVLSLSQIQGSPGLLILNSNSPSSNNTSNHPSLVSPVSLTEFVRNTGRKNDVKNGHHMILKQEAMDTNQCNQSPLHNSKAQQRKMDISNESLRQSLFDSYHKQNQEVSMPSAPSTPSKRMDTSHDEHPTFCNETVVVLGTDSSGSLISKSDASSIISNGFFNETLDLSQEDIQRTLSANMPLCSNEQRHESNSSDRSRDMSKKSSHHSSNSLSHDINPMDFINNCDVVSPTHVVDDDVFVNLDAFDMLGEFPDLEVLDSGHAGSLLDPSDTVRSEKNHGVQQQQHQPGNAQMDSAAKITDYSPEWAYPEGGVKVLVTGPWHSAGPYTVLFDTFPVPTTLVQSGVLRCYCPAHEAGLATLQVACDGYVISNSVIFEYKLPPKEEQVLAPEPKLERSNDNLLKFTLLQRLEAMDDRLQIKQEPVDGSDVVEDTTLFTQTNFEDRLVTYCQNLTSRNWRHGEVLSVSWFASHRGMTLLHLAASLGYSRLVCAMLHWRAENSSLLLETEVDALSQDEDGFTPLVRKSFVAVSFCEQLKSIKFFVVCRRAFSFPLSEFL